MSTVGAKIDALHALREEKRQLEELLKAKAQEIDLAENDLIEQMDQQNITKSTGSKATVSISTSVKPSVEDWDAFYAYITRTSTTTCSNVVRRSLAAVSCSTTRAQSRASCPSLSAS